jgi:inorganic pyrophosphatase
MIAGAQIAGMNAMMKFMMTVCAVMVVAQSAGTPPRVLPAEATASLKRSVDASRPHKSHIWRDTVPLNADGTVNAYVEIPKGERNKFEFSMADNVRKVDRVMPETLGGYPVNYGYVPQTVSYDGDPFDVLVLGPAQPGGEIVRGRIVGIMYMEDEKGLDSKVVVVPVDRRFESTTSVPAGERKVIGDFFARYKMHEPGKFSKVPGWGTAAEGLAFIQTTHAFFRSCLAATSACELR